MSEEEGGVRLKALEEEVSSLEVRVGKLKAKVDELGEGTVSPAVRYQNAGSWAIHFSNVRLAVATLSVTACIGVVAISGNSIDPWRATGVTMIAVFGWIVFAWASLENCRMIIRQRQISGPGSKLRKYFEQVPDENFDTKSLPRTLLIGKKGTSLVGDLPFKVVSAISCFAVVGVWAVQCPCLFDL